MKFVKIFSLITILAAGLYITGCSTAEQTTAKIAFQQGDFKKAETEFEKETKQNPQNEEAWYYLAVSRARLGKIEGVRAAITEYKKLGKNSFANELVTEWGNAYDEGFRQYEMAQGIKDETQQIAKYNDAVKMFQVAYALLPDSVVVKKNIDAINSKINTITIKPFIDKGVELDKAGNYEGALAEYEKALVKVEKGSAGYEVVIYNIAVSNLKWGEKMREANSEDPAYKEKYQKALPHLEELTKSESIDNKITAYDLLVQVYANLGMTDKATEAMKIRDELKAQNK